MKEMGKGILLGIALTIAIVILLYIVSQQPTYTITYSFGNGSINCTEYRGVFGSNKLLGCNDNKTYNDVGMVTETKTLNRAQG